MKHLVPFHRDPDHTDADLDQLMMVAVEATKPAYRVSPGAQALRGRHSKCNPCASKTGYKQYKKGIIQLFNIGAGRMLGYTVADVMNKLFLCAALDATKSLRFTRENQK